MKKENRYDGLALTERRSFSLLLFVISIYLVLLLSLAYVVKIHYSLDLYNSVYLLGEQCMEFARNILLTRFGKSFVFVLLLAVSVIYLVRGFAVALLNQLRTYKYVKSLTVTEVTDRYIRIDSDEPLAFTYGLFHQQVYISNWYFEKLTADELEAVILHEESHVKSRDNLKKTITRWFQFTLPYISGKILNDLNWEKLSEAKADAYVVEKLGSKMPLLSAMLKISNATFSFNSKFSLNYFFEDSGVSRVDFLTGKVSLKINYKKILILTLLPVLLTWFVFSERSLVFATHEHAKVSLVNVVPGTCTSITLPGYKSNEKPYSPAVNQSFK